jgi:hypothetical protein
MFLRAHVLKQFFNIWLLVPFLAIFFSEFDGSMRGLFTFGEFLPFFKINTKKP